MKDTTELWTLAEAACSGSVAEEQRERLNALLAGDDDAMLFYSTYLRMHGTLLWHCRDATVRPTTSLPSPPAVLPPIAATPVPRLPSTIFQTTLNHLSSGWPMAYLLATVIVGIGIAVMAIVRVPQPIEIVEKSRPAVEQQRIPAQKAEIVGRITGMVDCKWKDLESASTHNAEVSLGQTIALASGLMEITYDTGAKVLLQGPAEYEIESRNGGFMSVGKLTGKVTTASARGLAIRTPTAIVTDLGTEFGVEVDRRGNTTSHVFRGSVSLQPVGADKEAKVGDTILRVNESACVESMASGSPRVVVRRVVIKPDGFVRQLKNPSPVHVLAWFRMGEDDPDAIAGKAVAKQISDHRNYVHLETLGSPQYSNDTAAPGSLLAMSFNGGPDGACLGSARFPYVVTDYFIIEAWVRMRKPSDFVQTVVHNGESDSNGYALAAINGTWQFVFERVAICDSGVACELGKWTHLALVCERGSARLWVNGRAAGKAINAIPKVPDGPFGIGALYQRGQCAFSGEIDEVRLSTFIAPFQREMLLLRKTERSQ